MLDYFRSITRHSLIGGLDVSGLGTGSGPRAPPAIAVIRLAGGRLGWIDWLSSAWLVADPIPYFQNLSAYRIVHPSDLGATFDPTWYSTWYSLTCLHRSV